MDGIEVGHMFSTWMYIVIVFMHFILMLLLFVRRKTGNILKQFNEG